MVLDTADSSAEMQAAVTPLRTYVALLRQSAAWRQLINAIEHPGGAHGHGRYGPAAERSFHPFPTRCCRRIGPR